VAQLGQSVDDWTHASSDDWWIQTRKKSGFRKTGKIDRFLGKTIIG
jgi:hypothetical protein